MTEGERDDCALDLEAAFFLSEQDKVRMVDLVTKAVERHRRATQPCGRLKAFFRPRLCAPDAELE